jgi:hypothetical protein
MEASAQHNGDAAAAPPATMHAMDHRKDSAWAVSFGAAMVPITSFAIVHMRGGTGRVVEAVVRSPLGVYGLLLLPFATLAMEKCIYDTAQAAQGLDPTVRPADRGGFPSGGASLLPSLSLVKVQTDLPAWLSNRQSGGTSATTTTTSASAGSRRSDTPTTNMGK